MPPSLTSFLPFLSSRLGLSVTALYERQRLLVRHGMLPQPVGRGRGSGVAASPASVAKLLLSVLATDSLSESADLALELGNARLGAKARAPFERGDKFGVALQAILGRPEVANRVATVIANRHVNTALVGLMVGKAPSVEVVYFDFVSDRSFGDNCGLLVRASLTTQFLSDVATALEKEA